MRGQGAMSLPLAALTFQIPLGQLSSWVLLLRPASPSQGCTTFPDFLDGASWNVALEDCLTCHVWTRPKRAPPPN